MNRCILYRITDPDLRYFKKIDRNPLKSFQKILDEEDQPFHDEVSKKFLKKAFNAVFVDQMHLGRKHGKIAIGNLPDSMKEALMVLRNSQNGIYTDIDQIAFPEYFEDYENDALFACDVFYMQRFSAVRYIVPMQIENFTFRGKIIPLKLEYKQLPEDAKLVYRQGRFFRLYQSSEGYHSSLNFFTLFEYDWKRDLPDIKSMIDNRYYKNYKSRGRFEEKCTLYDLAKDDWFWDWEEDGSEKDYPIINHMTLMKTDRSDNRKLPIIMVKYRKDGLIDLVTEISCKYPTLYDFIYDYRNLEEEVEYLFFLVIDVEETIRDISYFEETWFGGYCYGTHTELFGKDEALMELSKQIPVILKNMKVPFQDDDIYC